MLILQQNAAMNGATLVHGTCAYITLLAFQVPLTIILSITHHKAAGVAWSLLIYAVIWPFVGCTCGVLLEFLAIGFGFSTCIVQLTELLDKRVTTINMMLALLSFFACAATLVLLIPCAAALSKCQHQRAVRSAYVTEILAVPRPHVCLTPPPQAIIRPPEHWIAVISPGNRIDIARRK